MKLIYQIILISLVGILISHDAQGQNKSFPEQLSLTQNNLNLNGHGVRRKYFITLYSLGLYLGEKSNDDAKIYNSNSNMNIRLVVESGFLSKEKLQEAVITEFKKQAGKKYESKKSQLEEFLFCFNAGVNRGDVFDFNFTKLNTLVILKNGIQVQKIRDLEFKQIFYKIWLGSNPVDDNLKIKLLGN